MRGSQLWADLVLMVSRTVNRLSNCGWHVKILAMCRGRVMVLSEVARRLTWCPEWAPQRVATTCGGSGISRLTEVASTAVPADTPDLAQAGREVHGPDHAVFSFPQSPRIVRSPGEITWPAAEHRDQELSTCD